MKMQRVRGLPQCGRQRASYAPNLSDNESNRDDSWPAIDGNVDDKEAKPDEALQDLEHIVERVHGELLPDQPEGQHAK